MKTYGHRILKSPKETKFTITATLNLEKEKQVYGKFSLGRDTASSVEIFGMLKGKTDPADACAIQM